MEYERVLTAYRAAAARISNYSRDELMASAQRAKVKFDSPLHMISNIELKKGLFTKINNVRAQAGEKFGVFNGEAKIEVQGDGAILITVPADGTITAQNHGEIRDLVASRFDGHSVIVAGYGNIARKWNFEEAIADGVNVAVQRLYEKLVGMYEEYPEQMIRISGRPLRGNGNLRAAKFKQPGENCVVDIIAKYKPAAVEKISQQLPHLKPAKNEDGTFETIYAYPNDLQKIAKIADVKLCVYSGVGAVTNTPWMEFGVAKRNCRKIDITVTAEHSNLRLGGRNIDKVVYEGVSKEGIENSTNIGEVGYKYIPDMGPNDEPPVDWYIEIDCDPLQTKRQHLHIMHKSFKPSSFTGNPTDDENSDYFHIHSNERLFYTLLKNKFNIRPTRNYVDTIKNSALFIGKGITEYGRAYLGPVTEADHNSSYLSSSNCDYFQGFPGNYSIAILGEPIYTGDLKPAFVILSEISFGDPRIEYVWNEYIAKAGGDIRQSVLTHPVYLWLLDHSANITVAETIYTNFQQFDIIKFAAQFEGTVAPGDFKKLRLGAVGRLIAGGMQEVRERLFPNCSLVEKEQIEFECMQNNYSYVSVQRLDGENNVVYDVRAKLPKSGTGAFHVHSYILSYSAIQMMTKFLELLPYDICSWNVDSITTVIDPNKPTETCVGGFKYLAKSELPAHYRKLVRTHSNFNHFGHFNTMWRGGKTYTYEYRIGLTPSLITPNKCQIITGTGGLGKSYPFLQNPVSNSVFTAPTHALKDDHRAKVERFGSKIEVVTTHKYFGINSANTRKFNVAVKPVAIVDELTLLGERSWLTIKNTADTDETILIVLGDIEQIRLAVNDVPISREWFEANGFAMRELKRTLDMICRHVFWYGEFLDTLRGKCYDEQVRILTNSGLFTIISEDDVKNVIMEEHIVIVGTHARAHDLNSRARAHLPSMNFKVVSNGKNRGKIVQFTRDKYVDEAIWWDQFKTGDPPKGKRYIPAFAVTADSTQGATFSDIAVVIDVKSLFKDGALYTGVTRAPDPDQVILII